MGPGREAEATEAAYTLISFYVCSPKPLSAASDFPELPKAVFPRRPRWERTGEAARLLPCRAVVGVARHCSLV